MLGYGGKTGINVVKETNDAKQDSELVGSVDV